MSEQEQPGEIGEALWHLAEQAHWQAALATGRYTRSTRGVSLAQADFIHASRPAQLPGVVGEHYADIEDNVLILEIDPAELDRHGVEVRLEPGDPGDPEGECFPHLYGPLPVEAVTRVRPARVDRGWLQLGPWERVGEEQPR